MWREESWDSMRDDNPVVMMIQIQWWCPSDDPDRVMIYIQWWWSRLSDDLDIVMKMTWIWRWLEDEDNLKMKMTWRWRRWDDPVNTEKKTSADKLCWENTFLVKRECWCICKFGIYSLVYFIYCTPVFIPGSICNVIESFHAPMFLSVDSIM